MSAEDQKTPEPQAPSLMDQSEKSTTNDATLTSKEATEKDSPDETDKEGSKEGPKESPESVQADLENTGFKTPEPSRPENVTESTKEESKQSEETEKVQSGEVDGPETTTNPGTTTHGTPSGLESGAPDEPKLPGPSQETHLGNDDGLAARPGESGDAVAAEESVSMEVSEEQEVEVMETEEVAPEETTVVTTESMEAGPKGEGSSTQSDQKPAVTEKGKPAFCYCGKGRDLDVVELQCSVCTKWFHRQCLSINLENCIPFMMSYTFCCKRCNPNNTEMYSRKVPNFSVLCYVVLANLTAQARKTDPSKTMFSKDKDIIPFIDANWELLTPAQRRTTVTWHSTIVKAMIKDSDMFICKEKPDSEDGSNEDYPFFGLLDQDLSKIGPNYDPRSDASNMSSAQNGNSGILMTSVGRGRGAKKRNLDNSQNVGPNKKSKGELNQSLKVSAHGYPIEHPYNKDGYRYTLTENDPHAPAALFDEDIWIGKPIPAHLYRKHLSSQVLLALHDRAPQLKVSADRLTVTGEKGYSMIRATHSVKAGVWYFEVVINQMPAETGSRIGWSQALGNLQAPLGYDKFGYSMRSSKGTKFHQSRGKHYGDGFSEGDVIGCMISLPEVPECSRLLPDTYKKRTLIKFKSHLYFEEKDEPTETEKNLKVAPGSKITFYKNGVNIGTAFEDIYDGMYYPSISLYKGCSATVNFGPTFKHPPKDISNYKALSDRAEASQVEQTLADAIFHVEHEKMYEDAARGILVMF